MWCVDINYAWRIMPNPEGSGIMLAVDRGISCEAHTHVLSHHTTNYHEEEEVRRVINDEGDTLRKRIDAFVAFVVAHDDWSFNEMIAVQFYHHLLHHIARELESNKQRQDAITEGK